MGIAYEDVRNRTRALERDQKKEEARARNTTAAVSPEQPALDTHESGSDDTSDREIGQGNSNNSEDNRNEDGNSNNNITTTTNNNNNNSSTNSTALSSSSSSSSDEPQQQQPKRNVGGRPKGSTDKAKSQAKANVEAATAMAAQSFAKARVNKNGATSRTMNRKRKKKMTTTRRKSILPRRQKSANAEAAVEPDQLDPPIVHTFVI
jgi:hypothetical protein